MSVHKVPPQKPPEQVYVTLKCIECETTTTGYFCHFKKSGVRTCFRVDCNNCGRQLFHQFQNCPHSDCQLRLKCLGWSQSQVLKVSHPYTVGWPNGKGS